MSKQYWESGRSIGGICGEITIRSADCSLFWISTWKFLQGVFGFFCFVFLSAVVNQSVTSHFKSLHRRRRDWATQSLIWLLILIFHPWLLWKCLFTHYYFSFCSLWPSACQTQRQKAAQHQSATDDSICSPSVLSVEDKQEVNGPSAARCIKTLCLFSLHACVFCFILSHFLHPVLRSAVIFLCVSLCVFVCACTCRTLCCDLLLSFSFVD